MTSDAVAKMGVKDLFNLMTTVPSLSYGETGQRTANKLTVRGLGVSTTGSSKASVFLDGVYIAGNYSGMALSGLDRIEVLKGPQSALFGRSTFAGAVNYVTPMPTNDFKGSMSVEMATLGEKRLDSYVSGAIVDDKLYGFLSGSFYDFDGPDAWTNVVDQTKHGSQSSKGFMGKLVYTPTPNLTLRAFGSYHSVDDGPGNALFINPADRNGVFQKINPVTGQPTGATARYAVGSVPYFRARTGDYNAFHGYLPDTGIRVDSYRSYLQGEWVSDSGYSVTLTGAHNYERVDSQDNIYLRPRPLPGMGGFIANAISRTSTTDDSLELRLASPQDKPIRVAVGGYYLNLEARGLPSTVFYYPSASPATDLIQPKGGYSLTRTRDKSIFGAIYADVTSGLSVSLEGRYQWEDIRATARRSNTINLAGYLAGTIPASYSTLLNPQGGIYQRTFKSFLPRVNVKYDLNQNLNVYATYSKGTNPGGFNTSVFATPDQQVIEEENLFNYEIGMKGNLTPKLSVELAAYHMDWKNQQTTGTFTSAAGVLYAVITNSANSKVNGAEALINWITPVDGLSLRGSVSYNDASYKNFCSANYAALTYDYTAPAYLALTPQQKLQYTCRAVDGNKLESVSKWQTSLSFDYLKPVADDWDMFLRGDWAYFSPQWDSEMNLAQSPSANIVNLRIGLQSDRWTFELYGKNITNEDSPVRLTRAGDTFAGATNATNQSVAFLPRRPRQFGGRIGVKF